MQIFMFQLDNILLTVIGKIVDVIQILVNNIVYISISNLVDVDSYSSSHSTGLPDTAG